MSRSVCILWAIVTMAFSPRIASAENLAFEEFAQKVFAFEEISLDACGANACCADLDCGCCCPTWTASADVILLNRTQEAFAGEPAGPRRSFSYEPGWALDLRRTAADGNEIQIRHFGLDSWLASMSYLDGAIPAAGFVNYSSEILSTEFNVRCSSGNRINWLIGFRWIEFNEHWNENNAILVFDVDDIGQLRNQMYGCQVGADIDVFDRGGPFQVDAEIKVGLFGSRITRTQLVVLNGFPLDPLAVNRSSQASFLGEINISASYQVCSSVALHAGYQLLWLNGIAMAPANFADGGTTLNDSGSLFAQGFNGGLIVTW